MIDAKTLIGKYTRQCLSDWIVVEEFRPSAGYKGDERRIDLWAIKPSSSTGFPVRAYEVKASRGDWLREIKQPNKRRLAMAISNEFYILAPAGIVQIEELPDMVGLIEFEHENGFFNNTHPAQFRDKVRPTWGLVASFARNLKKNQETDE